LKPTWMVRGFKPLKRVLPGPASKLVRSVVTAVATPLDFAFRSGHARSSFANRAVTSGGEPLPWYTYPAIDFLRARDFGDRTILEFGGGQSTFWWAERSRHVLTFEADEEWYAALRPRIPSNVDLVLVTAASRAAQVQEVRTQIGSSRFDVIVIDGLYREDMCAVAQSAVSVDGCIVADDSEGFEIFERMRASRLSRVDFYGYQPGVSLPHCTSVFFTERSFIISGTVPIIRL
jgi:hypothetical protein